MKTKIKVKEKNMRKNKQKNKNKIDKKSKEVLNKHVLKPQCFDPFGSYTGLTDDYSRPVQDADDL